MTAFRFIGLGVSVAIAGGRTSLARVGLMAVGIGLGVALLIGSLTLDHATQARNAREAGRTPGPSYVLLKHQPDDSTAMAVGNTVFHGRLVQLISVRSRGLGPVPPGLQRLPARGELFVSPALARLIDTSSGPSLPQRFQARVRGSVSAEGLTRPGELFGYVGEGREVFPPGPVALYSGGWTQSSATPRSGTPIVLGLVLLAFLFPIVLLVLTATRLSTASREKRLAAIRLAGATSRQVRLLIAIEAGTVAVLGSLAGLLLFALVRATALRVPQFAEDWFPSDLWPNPVAALAVLAVIPLLIAMVALVGSRRIVVSPLGLVRKTRRTRRRGIVWLYITVFGIAILSLAAAQHEWVMRRPSPFPGLVVVPGAACVLIGVVGSAGWISWLTAGAVADRTRSVALQLGARRLQSDPGSANRVVAGVATLVILVGLGQAVVLSEKRDTQPTYVAPWVSTLPASAVIADDFSRHQAAELRSLGVVPGVQSVRLTSRPAEGGVTAGQPHEAVLSTDGTVATLERIRNHLSWHGYAFPPDHLLRESQQIGAYLTVLRVVETLAAILLLVTAASLLIATVDSVIERRRTLAMLGAIGARRSTMRASILAQVAIPLAVALTLGVAAALALSALIFAIIGEPQLLPIKPLLQLGAMCGALTLGVTACALPWIKTSSRAELLHGE